MSEAINRAFAQQYKRAAVDLTLTKLLVLALDMLDLGEDHPWRHVHLQLLEESS